MLEIQPTQGQRDVTSGAELVDERAETQTPAGQAACYVCTTLQVTLTDQTGPQSYKQQGDIILAPL